MSPDVRHRFFAQRIRLFRRRYERTITLMIVPGHIMNELYLIFLAAALVASASCVAQLPRDAKLLRGFAVHGCNVEICAHLPAGRVSAVLLVGGVQCTGSARKCDFLHLLAAGTNRPPPSGVSHTLDVEFAGHAAPRSDWVRTLCAPRNPPLEHTVRLAQLGSRRSTSASGGSESRRVARPTGSIAGNLCERARRSLDFPRFNGRVSDRNYAASCTCKLRSPPD